MKMDFVQHLKTLGIEDTLKTLVSAFKKAGDDTTKYPYVQVTVGAYAFRGVPVKYDLVGSEPLVSIFDPDPRGGDPDSMTLIPVRAIATVKVLNFRNMIANLSGGYDPNAIENAPSGLQLQRDLAAALESLDGGKKFEPMLELADREDVQARMTLKTVVRELAGVLRELLADEMGADALKPIKAIKLGYKAGAALSAEKSGSKLSITAGNQIESSSELKKVLEKAL